MLLWPRRIPSTCCLILTTAYARYALDGFEADAVDFLHKPYFYDRFTRAIQKAIQWMQICPAGHGCTLLTATPKPPTGSRVPLFRERRLGKRPLRPPFIALLLKKGAKIRKFNFRKFK